MRFFSFQFLPSKTAVKYPAASLNKSGSAIIWEIKKKELLGPGEVSDDLNIVRPYRFIGTVPAAPIDSRDGRAGTRVPSGAAN